jgi:uncharacterized damage-inducible protein DinB
MMDNQQGDTSVLTKFFRYNTWANLKLLDFCEGLNDAQLDSGAIGGYGTIRETLAHYISSEVYYVEQVNHRLPADPPLHNEFTNFRVLREGTVWAADELLTLALMAREDTVIRDDPPPPMYEYRLTGLIVQVITHSAEHRTQIATIITQLGLVPPNVSLWAYLRELGELRLLEDDLTAL